MGFPWIFTVGTWWTGLTLGLTRYVLPFELRTLFVVNALLAAVAATLCFVHFPLEPKRATHASSIHATALAVLLTTLGISYYLPPSAQSDDQLTFKPVRDYFVHANQVVLLAGEKPFAQSSRPGLVGHTPPFYHYGSYVFPALLTAWAHVPAYDALAGVWAPWGLLLTSFSGFILGWQFFGRHVAVVCLVLSATFPDVSYWNHGPLAGLFPYYYPWSVLRIAPANSFGIATGCIAVVLSLHGMRRGSIRVPLLALAISASGIWFKAQLMIPVTLLTALMAALAIAKRGQVAWRLVPLIAAAMSIGVIGLQLENTPDIRLAWPPAEQLANWLVSHSSLSHATRPLFFRGATGDDFTAIVARVGAIGITTFGIFGIAVAVALVRLLLRGACTLADVIATTSLAIYIGMALFIAPDKRPLPWGHPWDLIHIPAVWAHFVALNWSVGSLVQNGLAKVIPLVPVTAAVTACGLVWNAWFGSCPLPDSQLTDRGWAHLQVPPAMAKITEFVRMHTGPEAVVQASDNDPYFVIEALGERRPYVGWAVVGSYTSASPIHSEFEKRVAFHEQLKSCRDLETIRQMLRATRIDWYVVTPSERVAWPSLPFLTTALSVDGWTLLHIDHSALSARHIVP